MYTRPRLFVRMLALFATVAAFAVLPPAHALGGGLFFSYTLVKADLTQHEPVYLKVVVRNELAEGVVVDLSFNGYGHGGFRGKITRPDGTMMEVPIPRPSQVGSPDIAHVPSSGSHTKVLLLSDWIEFDEPGRYGIEIETTRPILSEGGLKLNFPTGGLVTVDIGPRDTARLRKICADLESKALALPPNFSSTEPADALGDIHDPIAVPYMERLLLADERHFALTMIDGLEAIADVSAVDALISYWTNSSLNPKADPDVRGTARFALTRIESKTNDPTIQLRIRALPER